MSSLCSFCGEAKTSQRLKSVSSCKINVILLLKEAFKIELDSSTFSEICVDCETKLEVSWNFYQQIVKAQELQVVFIKEEIREEPVVKVEYNVNEIQYESPDLFENYYFDDDQVGAGVYEEETQESFSSVNSPIQQSVKKEATRKSKRIEESSNFECAICGHQLSTKQEMAAHMLKHTSRKDHSSDSACFECGKVFVTPLKYVDFTFLFILRF